MTAQLAGGVCSDCAAQLEGYRAMTQSWKQAGGAPPSKMMEDLSAGREELTNMTGIIINDDKNK